MSFYSRIDGSNYLVGQTHLRAAALDKEKTDKIISDLIHSFDSAIGLLDDESMDFEEEVIEFLSRQSVALRQLVPLMKQVKIDLQGISEALNIQDDEFNLTEGEHTLEDFGYKNQCRTQCYEKTLVDDNCKEVVEEVWLDSPHPRRRLRTTIWEQTDVQTRSSRDIKYEEIPIGEGMEKIISNTLKAID